MRVPGDPMPYVQQWNVAVERQIGKDASLTVAYAGSKGTHLLLQGWATVSNFNLNQLPDQYFSMGPAALLAQVPNPFFGIITTPGPPLRTNGCHWTAFAALPAIPASSIPGSAQGQIKLPVTADVLHEAVWRQRHPECGLYLVATDVEHRQHKCLSWTRGSFSEGATQDNNHLENEYSLSSYDVPHNLSVGYGVDLPFGRNKRFLADAHGVLNAIVGGWRVNGITTIRSGVPISA